MPLIGKAIKTSQEWNGVLANAIDYTIYGLLKGSGCTISLGQINTTVELFIGHESLSEACFMATTECRPYHDMDGFEEAFDYTGAILSLLSFCQEELTQDPLQLKRLRISVRRASTLENPFICNDLVDLAWLVGRPYFEREFNLHHLGNVKRTVVLKGLKRYHGYGGDTRKLAVEALTTALYYYGKKEEAEQKHVSFAGFVESSQKVKQAVEEGRYRYGEGQDRAD